jgi:FRG domain-containing protein
MSEIRYVRCQHWDGFKRRVYPALFADSTFAEGAYLFRGVADEDWRLVSSFDRYAQSLPLGERAKAANELLTLFTEECASDTTIDASPDDEFERVAVAQHHGLPTRALDWSRSPYVAAFFAFSNALENAARQGGRVAIWVLPRTHAYRRNERLLRQQGELTHLRAPHASLDGYALACPDDGVALWQFTIPRKEASAALADLGAMGITATRLFPDLTGAARAAQTRYAIRGVP